MAVMLRIELPATGTERRTPVGRTLYPARIETHTLARNTDLLQTVPGYYGL